MLSTRLNHLVGVRTSAVVGGAAWVAWLLIAQPSRTAGLLMLSPFVLVPLVIGLIDDATVGEQRLLRRLGTVNVPIALVAATSFAFDQGAAAALLAVPWCLFTVTLAIEGLLRLLGRRRWFCADLGFDLALMLISVGGVWLFVSRYGATLGFAEFIVELTAVHFHYAGFALPAVAAALSRHRHGAAEIGGALPTAVLVGVVATAIGITLGGATEWLGATGMALVGFAVAGRLIVLGSAHTGAARLLLVAAGVALGGGMVMALVWAWTTWFGVTGPGLDFMVASHGGLNALGFGLLGLIGLTFVPFAAVTERRGLRLGRPAATELAAITGDAVPFEPDAHPDVLAGDLPTGWRRDDFEVDGPAEFETARKAIVGWAGHRAAGITLGAQPPIAVGNHVALAIPVFGLATVTARSVITDVIDEANRFGFAYASTEHHPMDGVEAFIVEPTETGVRVTIPVVWRPAIAGARLVPPLTRWLQRRALARYLRGMTARAAAGAAV